MDIFHISVTMNAYKPLKKNVVVNNHTTKLECFAKRLWVFEICWKNDKVTKSTRGWHWQQ